MKLKKTIALFLSMILMFSAAACGKEIKTEEASKAETVQQETQLQTSGVKPGGGSGGTSSGTVQAQQTSGQAEEAEEEVEEYEEEDEEYKEYNENSVSPEEIYYQLFDTLIFNTVKGYDGLQAAERKIDHDAYPEKFDLREAGVVTPVKNQNPFGTCWAFGAIAACEISILSEKNTTYQEDPLDLSEHHLAWFVNMHLEDDTNQNGEGVWHTSEFNTLAGGFVYSPSVLLATGTGVALEKEFPYRGKKGLIDPETGDYSTLDDWSIDPKDRFKQAYELEETRILPTDFLTGEDGRINETALYDVKDELLAGRGVAISYNAGDGAYNADTNAHYGREGDNDGHCCCIVGWDDTFSKDNFCYHNKDGKTEKPAGDGAWIVKNSWGAETEDFPNYGTFGIPDEEGRASGYFYLSYYDETICTLVSFDFLVDETKEDYYMVDQYDYLHSSTAESSYSEDMLVMANEFEAEEDEVLRCISLESGAPGVHIHYEVCRVTDPGTGPNSAELWTQGDLDCRYAGFHRIDLDKPLQLKAGEHYLVSFYQEANVDGSDVYLVSFRSGENELGKDPESDYYIKGIVNPGESWLYFEGTDQWIDWYDIVQYWKVIDEKTDYDNFSIKGYADPVK